MNIPVLSQLEQEHLIQVEKMIRVQIQQAGGSIPFDQFMQQALYAPGLGYYTAGSRKFGAHGDFVTAPETSAFFSYCLANQCKQVLEQLQHGSILEFGAGSGVMAADILSHLQTLDVLPERYLIMELSPDLQQRQRELLGLRVPHLMDRIEWLSALPSTPFSGVVLANELLDAMPVHRFRLHEGSLQEQVIRWEKTCFVAHWINTQNSKLIAHVDHVQQQVGVLADGYESEVNLRLQPWMEALNNSLEQGALILLDYGYSRTEYYHPERHMGTLICHFRHQAHDDPLQLVGLQDITASVDFTAVAEAGVAQGMSLAGYTTQATFLLGCGLEQLLTTVADDTATMMAQMQGVKQLTLPSEMGERFKAIGLCKNMPEQALIGFKIKNLGNRL